MIQKKNIIFIEKNGLLEIDILPISDWNGFSKIIQFLEKYYDAEVLESFDGIWSRNCKLRIKNNSIKLTHDDFSNTIESLSKQDNDIVKLIGKDLEERLKGM